jgi:hypothetical protein
MTIPPSDLPIEVTPTNVLDLIQECGSHMALQHWTEFQTLYDTIARYQDSSPDTRVRLFDQSDPVSEVWNRLRANAVDKIMRKIDSARDYHEFVDWIQRLSIIVNDSRRLWNLLHTEVVPNLKVVLEDSHALAVQFFTPAMLFEYGIVSFLCSSLCELEGLKTEDALIDAFYAIAGYVRACRLDSDYRLEVPEFIKYLTDLLIAYSSLAHFDSERFVWLIEAIGEHLQLAHETFMEICRSVLVDLCERPTIPHPLEFLYDICVISKSPSLQALPILHETVNRVYSRVVKAQHDFLHRFIFGCCVNDAWTGEKDVGVSDPVKIWQLYIVTVSERAKTMVGVPQSLIGALIMDSLEFFRAFYGELKPSRARGKDLRRDIFVIVSVAEEIYPGQLPGDGLQKAWFLLAIAAATGASDSQIRDMRPEKVASANVFLGLEHTDSEFLDYAASLAKLSGQFSGEEDGLRSMFTSVRQRFA